MNIMKLIKRTLSYQKGAAVLVFALIMVTISTLVILFAGSFGMMQTKSTANMTRSTQAFEAAQAGLEYAINYLNQNNGTILASPVSGYIPAYSDSNTTNVTLANNAKYTFTYSNPTAYDYTTILITSVGTSDDDSATRTVSQLVQFGSLLVNVPSIPLIGQGQISLSGNSEIINTHSSQTVTSGSTVGLSGSASTILNSGVSSTAGSIQSDIIQNDAGISSLSSSDFFGSFFGMAPDLLKGSVANYYSNSSNTNYQGTLAGMTGTSIWIDQTGGTASLNGNATIGTAANPVLLIVNGDLTVSGNVTIYGYVFILGNATTDFTGNLTIVGSVGTTGNLNATGSIQVVYSPTTLDNLQNNSSMRYYAKIPGSWKDY